MNNVYDYAATVKTFLMIILLFGLTLQSNARPYDPVIVQGSSLPQFIGVPTSEIFVYAYKGGVWRQITFQIDEKDGTTFYGPKNGVLDASDEICFLSADMGDSVADFQWIADAESNTYVRYQIKAQDNAVLPALKNYVYVYRSSTLTLDASRPVYMQYTPATSPAANDTVKGSSYIFGHNLKAIPDYLAIQPSVGGNGVDIMDRWKIRFSGSLLGGINYTENEETALTNPVLTYKAGAVRVLRRVVFSIKLLGTLIPDQVIFEEVFYPFYSTIDTDGRNLQTNLGMEVLRQSMDFNIEMIGGKFFSEYNPVGITIDGLSDSPVKTLNVPGINWFMVRNSTGGVTTIVDMPDIGKIQELFYRDDNTINFNDTGDLRAFGESGIQVTSIADPPDPIVGTFGVKTTMYYLGPAHTVAGVPALVNHFQTPLAVSTTERTFVIPVELASFDGIMNAGRVELEWTTKSESKNYGFEIHRHLGDKNWETIGFVRGAGTTTKTQNYRFVDDERIQSDKRFYRLKQIDTDGEFEFSPVIEVLASAPVDFALDQNYPNPFNPSTEIRFQVPQHYEGPVTLVIYNLIGQRVRTLIEKDLKPGFYQVTWDGLDDKGREMASGAFIYGLSAGDFKEFKKMIKFK